VGYYRAFLKYAIIPPSHRTTATTAHCFFPYLSCTT
jgi:hypothetical protein